MEANYTFVKTTRKKYAGFDSKEFQETLMKWSMKDRINIQVYCFNEPFRSYYKEKFFQAFFQDKLVASTLLNVNAVNEWVPVGNLAESVDVEIVPCSVTSMAFFDRLKEPGRVVSNNGNLIKCLGMPIEDFEVFDELRKMLLDEESENRDLFSESEKQEFIFKIFFHLCLGGRLCQYEDALEPYLNATKLLYKDIVSVAKDPKTNELITTSSVFKVVAKLENGETYIPRDTDNQQNFCYLVVDPMKRVLTTIIHQYGNSFQKPIS